MKLQLIIFYFDSKKKKITFFNRPKRLYLGKRIITVTLKKKKKKIPTFYFFWKFIRTCKPFNFHLQGEGGVETTFYYFSFYIFRRLHWKLPPLLQLFQKNTCAVHHTRLEDHYGMNCWWSVYTGVESCDKIYHLGNISKCIYNMCVHIYLCTSWI